MSGGSRGYYETRPAVQFVNQSKRLLDYATAAPVFRGGPATWRSDDLSPPIAWERRGEWRRIRSELKACDTLFWAQLGSRPTGAIHLASYMNLRARRSNFVLDAWKPSLTKIGIVATLERLDPCFVAYSEATAELQRRFPMAKFVFLPLGAHTDIFYPRKEGKSIFAFWMGRRHEPLHRALMAYCEARGLRYVYSKDGGLSTEELGRLTSSAQYFVATPPDLDNTRRTGGSVRW